MDDFLINEDLRLSNSIGCDLVIENSNFGKLNEVHQETNVSLSMISKVKIEFKILKSAARIKAEMSSMQK